MVFLYFLNKTKDPIQPCKYLLIGLSYHFSMNNNLVYVVPHAMSTHGVTKVNNKNKI